MIKDNRYPESKYHITKKKVKEDEKEITIILTANHHRRCRCHRLLFLPQTPPHQDLNHRDQ